MFIFPTLWLWRACDSFVRRIKSFNIRYIVVCMFSRCPENGFDDDSSVAESCTIERIWVDWMFSWYVQTGEWRENIQISTIPKHFGTILEHFETILEHFEAILEHFEKKSHIWRTDNKYWMLVFYDASSIRGLKKRLSNQLTYDFLLIHQRGQPTCSCCFDVKHMLLMEINQ